MNAPALTKALSRRLLATAFRQRCLSSQATRAAAAESQKDGYIHPVYFKVKEKQQQYQVDNGLRIHQRHGTSGTILMGITVTLLAVGAVDFLIFIYGAMFPPKN